MIANTWTLRENYKAVKYNEVVISIISDALRAISKTLEERLKELEIRGRITTIQIVKDHQLKLQQNPTPAEYWTLPFRRATRWYQNLARELKKCGT